MPICGLYGRASTDKQGETIEHQISLMKEFVLRKNQIQNEKDKEEWKIPSEFIYTDEGFSAYKISIFDRPAMKLLMKDAKAKKFDTVLFKSVSRVVRDTGEAIDLLQFFDGLNIRLISYEENYDTAKAESSLLFKIQAILAEEESIKTGTRVSLGNKEKARKGQFPGSTPPFGYIRYPKIKDDPMSQKLIRTDSEIAEKLYQHSPELSEKTILNPAEVEAVKFAFELYASEEGIGTFKVAEALNKKGWLTRNGNLWSRKTISALLQNEAYIGHIVYGKTRYKPIKDFDRGGKKIKTIYIDESDYVRKDYAHDQIINEVTFKIVQEKIKRRNTGKSFNAAKHPLTGVMKCGNCGGNMICQERGKYRYYICSTYHKYGRDECPQANIVADDVELIVFNDLVNEVKKYQENKTMLSAVEFSNQTKKELEKQIRQVDKEIQVIIQKIANAVGNAHLLDEETLKDVMEQFNKEKKEANDKKQALEEQKLEVDEVEYLTLVEKSINEFLQIDITDRNKLRTYFHLLINRVDLGNEGLEIHYVF